ncbi:MAG: Lrp/AsnC ligand binding domain-containing protein [Clostridium sp.]|jgi:Lrp/AsnC family transcriptional regulator for asnA, asnC and gidA|uniref:Lrp/AsnC ligand binding domain-containing protein n=1 Tax=Clostridium sp. TaxID=1506 RepID=UPI0025C60C1D|nr:Lrp/AsnC ligand binding domain-containing protein [Clostridium sp.]MCH3964976.1 Lrp/AsnC ligand binding domain-containing protein [Clostridium sp.]MCI1716530.1 Lrp/AsnC ligand binding domain-containing protein [Clostridium sp.]MCI1800988.1 Lrp/AsnC ligand binding domain-containing protein [Clostridium sp.]MCI1814707.1 Lrp/AsnC ligand binding domain-containing protein [Clostridium sp.]MCI1871735.1 Lrp/AsnC ligand binding domain-containing protein [Clostridium sp.]
MSTNFKIKGLDDLDIQILDIMIKDSRTPFLEIARQCHVSGGTIHVRMKKMEDMDIIKGTKLIIDNSKIGYDVCCFIGIYLDRARNFNEVLDELNAINEIVELHYTTGEYSIFVKVICRNIADLQNLLMNKIQVIDGIQRTNTFISLYQPIDRNIQISLQNSSKQNSKTKS